MINWKIIILLTILALLIGPANSAQILVPAGQPTIQAAVDAAANGDEIILAQGTYTGPGNRDIDFGGRNITVRGIDPEDAAVSAATIIDCQGSVDEPHRGFIFQNGETDAVLAGLTICNGYQTSGGAIKVIAASPSIRQCVLSNNVAGGMGPFINGGALSIENGGTVTVSRSVFSGNACDNWGGAIFCSGNLNIDNCLIVGNTAYNYGGGIYSFAGSIVMRQCTVADNRAGYYGGGMRVYGSSAMTATGSIFWGNGIDQGGGSQIALGNSSTLGLNYCDVQLGQTLVYTDGSSTLTWGTGNLDNDPVFVQRGSWDGTAWVDGDYRLGLGSSALDAGDPAYALLGGETDLDIADRIINSRVDMGAYENATPPSPLQVDSLSVTPGTSITQSNFTLRGRFLGTAPQLAGIATAWSQAASLTVTVGPYQETIARTAPGFIQLGNQPYYLYRGTSGAINLMVINFTAKTFQIMGQRVDLTGLGNPVAVSLEFGSYQGAKLQTVPNLSLKFLRGVANVLTVDSVTIAGAGNDRDYMQVRGKIAVADVNTDLQFEQITLNWGSGFSTTFPDIDGGEEFRKVGANYIYTRSAGNTTGKVTSATFNLEQGTWSVLIRNATISQRSGTVPLQISFFGFNEAANYHF